MPGVAVVVEKAEGIKCARSWKILPDVGSDPQYPDVSPRDAKALREWKALGVERRCRRAATIVPAARHDRSRADRAIAVLALDQASKFWLLFVFDLAHRGSVQGRRRSSTWCWP